MDGLFDLRAPAPAARFARPKLTPEGALASKRLNLGFMHETNGASALEPVPGFHAARARTAGLLSLGAGPAREAAIQPGFRPESQLGEEDRVPILDPTALPWRSIARLSITYEGGGSAIGTAWFVGPRALATAGHNLRHPEQGVATTVRVTPAYDGRNAPFDTVAASQIFCEPAWLADPSSAPDLDYGVVVLPDRTMGQHLGWFGIASYTDDQLVPMLVNVSGYAADLQPQTQWYAGGRILDALPKHLLYDFDTSFGMSGAPIFAVFGKQRVAIGIHTDGGDRTNRARRIDDALFDRLMTFVKM